MAENKRPPFDLPEAESELVAGYFTEYSGMRFGLFYLSEFIQVVVIAGLVTAVFLGGWTIPWLSQEQIIGGIGGFLGVGFATGICLVLHVGAFFTKLVAMIWLQMLIRWSLPRFRYDQVMDLCWKVILPLSLVNIFVTAFALLALDGSA
jgi:NADH-quinone oxidoreductase subunit H